MKNVIIIGAGLGGLSTALRLASSGYKVTIREKNTRPGGRLNELSLDGYRFDIGPSFMSMSYELEELFQACGIKNPLKLRSLDPLYQVYFAERETPLKLWRDLETLETEFQDIEPNTAQKVERYLHKAREFFSDTEYAVIKTNFYGWVDYFRKLLKVPVKHLPYLFANMWDVAKRNFCSEELRVIFCLVAFFLGTTPFQTPAIYSLLNYVEFRHNGYWIVEGGMYRLVDELVRILKQLGADFVYETEITNVYAQAGQVVSLTDQKGRRWAADIYVCNADAAMFRGLQLNRAKFHPQRLDKMQWSLAPFTIYLGVKGKIANLLHHNYFLGNNFKEYADTIFTATTNPEKPYYYVNVPTKWCPDFAPQGCESVFVLCPVPDLRFKKEWRDKESLADTIIQDLSKRIRYNIPANVAVRKVLSPEDWANMFNLYRGSGLGLCHGITQIGALRPSNKDEELRNLYYVGASTIPGTGLPMVIISSKLVQERIEHDFGTLPTNFL
jgi:phytoene desaturase